MRLFKEGGPAFGRWVHTSDCRGALERYSRMLFYSPFADACVRGGYRGALSYHDAQAIYPVDIKRRKGDSKRIRSTRRLLRRWILRDARGRPLYVPFDCAKGRCPQYAADIGNPRFRARLIGRVRRVMARGYRGVFLDDVNFNLNVSDGRGRPRVPIDPRTSRPMLLDDWRRYMADFVIEVRRAIGDRELTVNSVWWRGENSLDDPNVARGVTAATHFHMERGTADTFRGHPYEGLLGYADRLHALGVGVNLDGSSSRSRREAEFELGTYFLTSTGADTVSADYGACPDNREGSPCEEPFWRGYNVRLGAPLAARTLRPDGLLERRFGRGMVLVNPPGAPRRQADLAGLFFDLDGNLRISTSLEGGEAAILTQP